jgi:hypothetical protein
MMALAILYALPPIAIFYSLSRYIASGLTGNLASRLPFRVCRGKVLRRAVCPPRRWSSSPRDLGYCQDAACKGNVEGREPLFKDAIPSAWFGPIGA